MTFNLTGTLIFIWFIPYYAQFVEFISPKGLEIEIIARQIANAHLCFNLFNTILFIPLIGLLVKLVTKMVPGKELDRLPSDPIYLDNNVLEQPFVAIHLATKELARLGNMVADMITTSQKAFIENDSDKVKVLMEKEENVNNLQEKIVNYLAHMFSTETTTEEQAAKVSGLMHVAADIEHIGDHCKNIAEFAEDKIKNSYEFSNEAYGEIYSCFELAKQMMSESILALENRNIENAENIRKLEAKMNMKETELRKQHMKRLNEKKCSPEFTVIYTDVVHNIEKIGDYCNNIADSIIDDNNSENI